MQRDLLKMDVKGNKIGVIKINEKEYISLTDLARYANEEDPKVPVYSWMRNKNIILYLGLWESIYNKDFKGHEFETFKNEAGSNNFYMSPQKWINATNAIGIVSKRGRYSSGTYAHSDIAFEFASWLSPEFKLYLIQEFQRLKKREAIELKQDWQANRILSKANYLLHTDAIKNYIVPNLTEKQKRHVYADEADILNVALFGMTAKEWKKSNPKLKGNIRDNTDLLHLIILNNLENSNTEFIKLGLSQKERLVRLNKSAINQMELLKKVKGIKELENLQKHVNNNLLNL